MKNIILGLGSLALMVAVTVIGFAAPSEAKSIELRFAFHSPPMDHWYSVGYEPWTKEVEKHTEGRVKIKCFPAGIL